MQSFFVISDVVNGYMGLRPTLCYFLLAQYTTLAIKLEVGSNIVSSKVIRVSFCQQHLVACTHARSHAPALDPLRVCLHHSLPLSLSLPLPSPLSVSTVTGRPFPYAGPILYSGFAA